jgi:hypothetical protein
MLDINDVPLEEQWRLTAFEVMKYNPKFRNSEGHYLKKEWTEFEIGKIFDGVELTYDDYKVVEDKYILAFKYLFEYFKCDRIQFVESTYFLEINELGVIRDQELEKFYLQLKRKRTLNLEEAQKATRLILRSAMYGRFYCKGNKEIGVRFGYDFYMFFNVPEANKREIRDYIEKNIGLFTTR